jgi:pimeloyl-ACP methyl ester carboxylesterase
LEELKELAGARSVALFGLRFGATLAARVAARAPKLVTRLILWDPIVDGEGYLDALSAQERARMGAAKPLIAAAAAPDGPLELDGLRVSPAFVSAVRAIGRCALPPELRARTLMIESAAAAPAEPAVAPADGASLSSSDPAPWAGDAGAPLPVSTVDQIIRWMG